MKTRTFGILSAATAIAVALAVLAVNTQPSFKSSDTTGEPIFPSLANDLNKLSTVVVRAKDSTYTLDLRESGWTFRERGNYPADGSKVTEAAVKIARMTTLEAKTALPDRFGRLDLEDPGGEDNRAKQITLLDKGGGILADLIIGKRKFTLGSKEGGTYVRRPGENQTWLAFGELNPGEKARDWLKRDVTDIKDDAIKQVVVTHPDGEKIIAGQDTPSDPNFKILNMPKGREQTSDFVADDFGRLLAILLLDDVTPAAAVDFSADKTIQADFEGFAGFHVHLDYVEADGKHWIKVKGKAPQSDGQEAAAATESPAEGGEADWSKIIGEINSRTEGWAYEVPAYEVNALKKKMSELTRTPNADSAS